MMFSPNPNQKSLFTILYDAIGVGFDSLIEVSTINTNQNVSKKTLNINDNNNMSHGASKGKNSLSGLRSRQVSGNNT